MKPEVCLTPNLQINTESIRENYKLLLLRLKSDAFLLISLSLSHEYFMLLVYANPPIYLCLYSKTRPSSKMCCKDLILRQRIQFLLHRCKRKCHSRLPISVTYSNFNPLNSVIVLIVLLLLILISFFFIPPFIWTGNTDFILYSPAVWHQMNALLKHVFICYLCFVFQWLRAWFRNRFQKQSDVFPYVMLFMTIAHWSAQSKPNESINRLWHASCHLMDIWLCQCSFEAGLGEHMHDTHRHTHTHTLMSLAPDSVIPHWKPN